MEIVNCIALIGFFFVFGMIVVLLVKLKHDTAAPVPQDGHFRAPVELVGYREEILAMQDGALNLLNEEPIRGYLDLVAALLAWLGPSTENDNPGPVDRRLGPQNPVMEVGHRDRL
ncbi:hypothetical protein FRB90_011816 [Tulasnella sp. 427]|nr:hypothetical protein FRB90_011816 [Tulasnella sp. 427]